MKQFKVTVKKCSQITYYVKAKNKKKAKQMVQEVVLKTNLMNLLNSEHDDFIYKIREEKFIDEQDFKGWHVLCNIRSSNG